MEIFAPSQGYTYNYSKADVYIEKKSTEIADSISKSIENAINCSQNSKENTEKQNV